MVAPKGYEGKVQSANRLESTSKPMIYCKRALFITAASQAASFRPSHLPIHTSAIPQQNIPTPISGNHHCECRVIMMAVSPNTEKRQSPSHSDINILTNFNVVKRPTNITRPFLISKRPTKNGFQELPTKGITRRRETRVSFTGPTARWRVNAENTEREVAFFRRSMDSSSPNKLSNSALVEPYRRFDNQFICTLGFVKSVVIQNGGILLCRYAAVLTGSAFTFVRLFCDASQRSRCIWRRRQKSASVLKASARRRAMSAEIPARPFNTRDNVGRVTPRWRATSVTDRPER